MRLLLTMPLSFGYEIDCAATLRLREERSAQGGGSGFPADQSLEIRPLREVERDRVIRCLR
jgi:hypothetical protein